MGRGAAAWTRGADVFAIIVFFEPVADEQPIEDFKAISTICELNRRRWRA
jgi:hypothetical protein